MSFGRLGTWCGPVTVALAILAGCGGKGNEAAFTPVPGSDSAYCATYRAWKVYELDNGEAYDQPDPVARGHAERARDRRGDLCGDAPAEIRAVVEVSERHPNPHDLLEKYGRLSASSARLRPQRRPSDQPSSEMEWPRPSSTFEERCDGVATLAEVV
jgi:hypothetical protein